MVGILPGVILSLSFEPAGLWFCAPIAFALFFRGLKRTLHPNRFVFLFTFTFNAIVLYWTGKYVGSTPWILLSLLQTLFYLPIALIYSKTRSLYLLIPAFITLDFLRSIAPFGGFGWTQVAFSQADAPYVNLVGVGGVALLTFCVLSLALLITDRPKFFILPVLLLLISPQLLHNEVSSDDPLNFAAVQGNTPSVGLDFNGRAKAVFDLHVRESLKIDKEIDLIIWPENAADIDPLVNVSMQDDVAEITRQKSSPLLMGAVLNSREGLENAAILFSEDGKVSSIYVKRHLTPFGEYMPLRSLAEFVSPYASSVSDFTPGSDLVIHNLEGEALSSVICYEIIDNQIVREAAKNSRAIIVLTNSATFAGTAESAQQLAITRIRAIESSRQMVSVSTVGISALIDQNGQVLSQTDENVAQILYGSVAFSDAKSFANRLGGWATPLVLGLSCVLAWVYRNRR